MAGFLLTAVPELDGPVAGVRPPADDAVRPVLAGRLVLLQPDLIGVEIAAAVDSLFLPALLFICAREIVAGRKWKDLKVLGVLAFLSAANICFHVTALSGEHGGLAQGWPCRPTWF